MSSAYAQPAEEGRKGGKVADSKAEQELKRTAAQPVHRVSDARQRSSRLPLAPAAPLRPLTRLLPSSASTPPRSVHRSVDSWRQTESRTCVNAAATSGARDGEMRPAVGGHRPLPLNGVVGSNLSHKPPSSHPMLHKPPSSHPMLDGGTPHPQRFQDVRQARHTLRARFAEPPLVVPAWLSLL